MVTDKSGMERTTEGDHGPTWAVAPLDGNIVYGSYTCISANLLTETGDSVMEKDNEQTTMEKTTAALLTIKNLSACNIPSVIVPHLCAPS